MVIADETVSGKETILHRLAAYISKQIAECEKCNEREFTFLAVTGHDFALPRVYNVLEQFYIPDSWREEIAAHLRCGCCGRSLRLDHRVMMKDGLEKQPQNRYDGGE
ncbi:hypothetical protein [Paenibacillus sp. HJGM_3]|uniref:hypothetical protein n=1 Tax=Paenibacillus sp. HJGM_3 TaxID=3379816 RepID=UPI00385927D4